MPIRLGIVLDDDGLLRAGRDDDPVEVVVLRSTFLNPPRAAATKRIARRIKQRHTEAELIPYAWHYLTHDADDGLEIGSNRSLDAPAGSYGHFRGDAIGQAWEITKICAEALDLASRVVVRTPPSFSPGSLSRRRFTRFVEGLGPSDPKLIWEPQGLWTSEGAAAFAKPLGVEILAPAFGLTGQPLEFEGASWLRIGGAKDARLRSSHAEILANELLGRDEELTVLFEGPRAYTNLRAFARELV